MTQDECAPANASIFFAKSWHRNPRIKLQIGSFLSLYTTVLLSHRVELNHDSGDRNLLDRNVSGARPDVGSDTDIQCSPIIDPRLRWLLAGPWRDQGRTLSHTSFYTPAGLTRSPSECHFTCAAGIMVVGTRLGCMLHRGREGSAAEWSR